MAQASFSTVRENELQKLLADERSRTEQHRLNYQTLKSEHQRVNEENASLTEKILLLSNETRQYREYDKKTFQQTEQELTHTRALVAELKSQLLTPAKVELLKAKHEEEFEQQFSEILTRAESETDKYRQEFNKMRYEYGFLKAEFEHERVEWDRRLEESKMKYESEIARLKKEKDSLTDRRVSNQSGNLNATKMLQKENLQLNQLVAELNEEINEIRNQLEQSENKTSEMCKEHIGQITEFTAQKKSHEVELSTLHDQWNRSQQNLRVQTEKSNELQAKLLESNRELSRLHQLLEDTKRNIRLDSANRKVDAIKEKANFKQEMSSLEQLLKSLKCELEEVHGVNEKHSRMLIEKEKETAKRLQAIRQEESQKTEKIEAERLDLEMKYLAAQQRISELEERMREEMFRMEEKLRNILEHKLTIEKDNLVIRTKLEHCQKQMEATASQQTENVELRQQLIKLKADLHVTGEAEERLIGRNKELNAALETARREIESFGGREEKRQSQNELNAQRGEIEWEREKIELQKRSSKLERQIKSQRRETSAKCNAYKKKINKYSQLITKLRNRSELHNAKIEELNIEKEALKKSIPQGDPNTIKRQLRDLQHRHEEFRRLLQTHHLFGGEASIIPLDSFASVWRFANEQESQQQSLLTVRDRLKRLDEVQNSQMQELVELKLGKL